MEKEEEKIEKRSHTCVEPLVEKQRPSQEHKWDIDKPIEKPENLPQEEKDLPKEENKE
jgi:hypothetical protein